MPITVRICETLYSYDELATSGQEHVCNQIVRAWLECPDFCVPGEARAKFDAAIEYSEERMRTPWFDGSYVWDYCKPWIEAEARCYYYLQDGELFGPMNGEYDIVKEHVSA